MKKRIISLLLLVAMTVGLLSAFVGCKGNGNGGSKTDALVIMTEQLDGIFNPFFSTSATDGTIVSMTQIGMLSSKYENGEVKVAFGDNEAVVTKDYAVTKNGEGDSVYTFVIKNGILYSDGHPLTIEDVLFNLYLYLDPVYTGSATIYSTAIKGLNAYRKQDPGAGEDDDDDDTAELASANALMRLQELVQLYWDVAEQPSSGSSSYYATVEQMKEAIKSHLTSYDYNASIMTDKEMDEGSVDANAQLLLDYENALKKFKEELYSDFESAKDAYTEEPYKSFSEFENDIFCFFFAEGYVEVKYAYKPGTTEPDKSKIETLTPTLDISKYDTIDKAVERVYNDMITSNFHNVLLGSITTQELLNEFTAKAKDVIIHNHLGDGELKVPNIDGIKSLAHEDDTAGTTITVNGNEYKIATAHDANGVPTDGYDVLQITIDGVDPKAQWNFAFSVAPQHYYGEGAKTAVDIKNNKFGVDYSSSDFMMKIVQSVRNIKLPMGAGAYKVTDRSNSDTPSQSGFYTDGVVYFKANENFTSVGEGINNAKIAKVRYQVVSASNAIGALQEGSVHYITPQLTKDNYEKLTGMKKSGYNYLESDQLGYGYIGINATHIPNINIRKAIMCAMNTTLALDYYYANSASQIYWPMSKVSWAYPKDKNGNYSVDNTRDYPQINEQWSESVARANIQKYMDLAGVSANDPELTVEFTIAGANLQEHPTYKVFRDAAALLNSMGWDITVEADTQALTKINTGALEVWAAAWGSTIDPDMYQIYHKNSTATSTKGWGYDTIKKDEDQKKILDELSELIDAAREITDEKERAAIYEEAMKCVLDLAVELPVYQRSVIYAYNANVIDPTSLPSEVNPFSSPLDKIWELDLK
jgi:peptide/nickel transport system substrate-binding protein